ncbi:SAM-dependent methyltransferase [Paenibacillus xerothermodurans]|uniref:SAM-dependent methyltransferase n=1 Tax=Paenibacillus xerothermodurans TaxID=1977292 RepID=A0A2W1NDY2_PAEXE|nr:SAM-dependent methyltransferase [Paenibacillus xerothermodurans]PZE21820.1 SAM-dependent methyltransferase [Paenibacillus xerothermodurans]
MTASEYTTQSLFIGTANHGYAQQAQEEIRRLFGTGTLFNQLTPAETYLFQLPVEKSEAIRVILAQEPMFLRHMQPVDAELEWDGTLKAVQYWIVREFSFSLNTKLAIQVRKTEHAAPAISTGTLKQALDSVLVEAYSVEPVTKEADFILSVYLTAGKVYAGLSKPEHNLSDWSGGAIRFRKEAGQVSRAKFKLLEAEQEFGLDFAQYRSAIDIGAAPGGWTSLLLERGVKVTAIDPAKLDASLLKHPNLTYLKKNAGDVRLNTDAYDLLVCDMSWSSRQMAKLVKGLLHSLQTGGTAVITVKLMHKKPFQAMRELVEDLAPELALQKAKQLFHNRDELTAFFIKN